MKPRTNLIPSFLLAVTLLAVGSAWSADAESSTVSDKVNAVAQDVKKEVASTTEAAQSKIEKLWRRIDEKRLQNRSRDEIVAWVIMGLLVSALIHRLTKLKLWVVILLGLVGAFVGGIVGNVAQLDLGMGPVLIRYEDLLFSLLGGLVIILIGRWLAVRKKGKA